VQVESFMAVENYSHVMHIVSSVVGELRPSLVRRFGLPQTIPVVAGAGDSIACAIGAGVTAPGPVSEMAGSSSCFNSVVPEPLADPDITHYPSAVGDHGYVTEVGLNTTGEALDWLAQLFYDRAPRRDDFPRIARAAAQAREQLTPATVLVMRMIEPGQLALPPGGLRDFRLQQAGVTIQTDHIAVPHLAQRTAVQAFRRDMNGGRHAAGRPRHPAVGDQSDLEALALQRRQ